MKTIIWRRQQAWMAHMHYLPPPPPRHYDDNVSTELFEKSNEKSIIGAEWQSHVYIVMLILSLFFTFQFD